ncbi:MAG TPA: pantetheine-phosphate adenylyltransferase [Candidatus Glassbacteria bacterium]|nr:pantetheine-phosphate adenylyltransferase [Candidatus Glassbacteria bacterium]
MKIAIYPGTFDPVTFGHLDIARRSLLLADKVVIAVASMTGKQPSFTLEERVGMMRQSLVEEGLELEVDAFDCLLVDYARRKGARMVIRGLRAVSDFEYEFQMALMNKKMAPDIEEVFLTGDQAYIFLSSSLVREVAALGGNVSEFVPPNVEKMLARWYKNR